MVTGPPLNGSKFIDAYCNCTTSYSRRVTKIFVPLPKIVLGQNIAANHLLRIVRLASFCPTGESRCRRVPMSGDIIYIAILAKRVAKGSQWQATYSRYLYWRIALQKDRNGGRHRYRPIVLQKDRRGGRHLVYWPIAFQKDSHGGQHL